MFPKRARLTILLVISFVCLLALGGGCPLNEQDDDDDAISAPTTTGSSSLIPDIVTTPSPAINADNVYPTSQISWAAANNATSYDVYLGTDNPPTMVTNTVNAFYNTGTLAFDTTYYWQVNSKNEYGATTGNIWMFSTQTGTTSAPAQVTLLNPANSATMVSITIDPSWAPANGATSYDVYFGTSNPPTFVQNISEVVYNPGVLVASTTYYWRVDSKNSLGTTTGNIWSFETQPESLPDKVGRPSPANGATSIPNYARLNWGSANGATSYDVYVGTTNQPSFYRNVSSNSCNIGPLNYITVYYWRIDAKNSAGVTQGDVWTFTTCSDAG